MKIVLPDHVKEATKVAVAMVITYWITLALDWDKPFWAGMAVALVCLATTGESIAQGIQRTLGTVLGGAIAMALMGLFPQERWFFLIAMSVTISILTYLMNGSPRFSTFLFAAGLTIPIIAGVGGPNGLNSFDIAILRVQQTTLGILVYSVVVVVLWPRRAGTGFRGEVEETCRDLNRVLVHDLRNVGSSFEGDAEDAERLRVEVGARLAALGPRLENAAYDSVEIGSARHAWRHFSAALSNLSEAMGRYRDGSSNLAGLDLERLMPGSSALAARAVSRLASAEAVLAGRHAATAPDDQALELDQDSIRAVTPLERAGALLCRDELIRIDGLTREVLDTALAIDSGGGRDPGGRPRSRRAQPKMIDLDLALVTLRQAATLWAALLVVIYVEAVPISVALIALANAFSMRFSTLPFVPARVLFMPLVIGAMIGGLLYVLVMPHLSGFSQLGAMIFAAVFLIAFVFHSPKAAPAKTLGLVSLVIFIGVDGQQQYSFLYFANWLVTIIFFVLIMMATASIPVSFRPEDRFVSLLRRFARSVGFLVSRPLPSATRETSWLQRRQAAFHRHEVATLPRKLEMWSKALPSHALGETGGAAVHALMLSVHSLSDRIDALAKLPSASLTEPVSSDLATAMSEWHEGLEEAMEWISADPGKERGPEPHSRFDEQGARLRARIERVIDDADDVGARPEQAVSLYRLLGTCAGVSLAVRDLMQRLTPIDWGRLREARF